VQGKLERFSLSDGEDAVIHELRAPLGAAAEALKQFWAALDGEQGSDLHRRDIASRLASREDIGDRWYVATTIEGIVCALELSRSNRIPHLGSVHHLYTTPSRREQGLARHVLEVALDRFASDGGHAVIVQLKRGTPAYNLFADFHFEDYLAMPAPSDRVTVRRVFGDSEAFEQRFFSAATPEALARRPLRRSDKSALLHLFSHPVPYLIRYFALHVVGQYGFEDSVMMLLETLERGQGTSVLGVAAEGTPAALGTVLPADLPSPPLPYREHVRLLDLFARPGFEDALGPVLEALLVRADLLPGVRRLLSVVDEENSGVRAALEDAGFVQAGTLHDYVMYGDRGGNAVFYELTRSAPDTPAPPQHGNHAAQPEGKAGGDSAGAAR
jgi:GNAT superfamily N-acetyltransferase/RimJ/RimL family protein N-acetyltransferase